MKLKTAVTIFGVSVALLFTGCGGKADENNSVTESVSSQEPEDCVTELSDNKEVKKDIFAMDTYMTLTAYGSNAQAAVDKAAAEIERLDALLSTGNKDSEIAKLNSDGSAQLSEDGKYLVERALSLYKDTDGAFDIAIYPVMEAWGFPTQNYAVPGQEQLKGLRELTDASKILYDKETGKISFGRAGMKIDLGGIAKGYTSSRVMEIYKENGIKSGLINLGGNVQTLGKKTDGSDWKIAIQNPDDTNGYLGILTVSDKAVITSGGYERNFEKDGVTYHHIIDPETGYPAETGLVSVTIVSDDGTLADGLSTSLFIMGETKAVDFWKKHSDKFDAILETSDGKIHVTEGIKDCFKTEFDMEVIAK